MVGGGGERIFSIWFNFLVRLCLVTISRQGRDCFKEILVCFIHSVWPRQF